jgi:hypothetical protein
MAKWKIITVSKQDKHTLFDLTNAIEDKLNQVEQEGYEVKSIEDLTPHNSHSVVAIYCLKKT